VARALAKLGEYGDYASEIGYDDPLYEEPLPQGVQQVYADVPTDLPESGGGFLGDALTRLREAEARFENAYFQLDSIGPAVQASGDAGALNEWASLKSHADMVREGLRSIASGASNAVDTFKAVFGLSAVRRIARRTSRRGMGAVPLLPAAAIVAAIGIVIAAANSMMQFVVNWRRAESGKSAVPGTGGGVAESLAGASDLAKWLVLGALIYYAAPPLLKMLEGRQ